MASFMTSLKEYPELCLLRDLVRRKKLKTWLVGGFLRDLFLEREGHDFDFAVEKDAVRLARAFAKKVHGAFVLLDEEHGCARVARKKAGRLWTFDFADLRARTLRADLIKRDFTVNTFALDLSAIPAGRSIRAPRAWAVHGKTTVIDGFRNSGPAQRTCIRPSLRSRRRCRLDECRRGRISLRRPLVFWHPPLRG